MAGIIPRVCHEVVGSVFGLSDAETEWMTADKLVPLCKPGDLIEFYRGPYCHWAMCSDEPDHVFNIDAEDMSYTKARISLRKLVDVANSAARPEHRVVRKNNKSKSARVRGICERPIEEVLKAAREDLDNDVPYSFLYRNCESYCCSWKFGSGWTDQAELGLGRFAGEDTAPKKQTFGELVVREFVTAVYNVTSNANTSRR